MRALMKLIFHGIRMGIHSDLGAYIMVISVQNHKIIVG